MGQQQSKDELLYQKAIDGDIQSVIALSSDGAGLEWVDKDGKTPLIAACMDSECYALAKTLIELGANVNAYRPGCHAGTPLHHAAKRGLDSTVRLLLSNGANLFVRNDDCQTPLDVARSRGFTSVARLIENHICFFSGYLTEFYGPGFGFLEVLAPKLLSRKIWAVVTPCAPHNPAKPLKLELAIYSSFQDAQPRAVVALWKADIEEPKLNHQVLTLMILEKPTRTRYKFAASNDDDEQQIQSLYLACKGISQVMHTPLALEVQASAPMDATQTADNRLPPHPNHNTQTSGNVNSWTDATNNNSHNGWGPARVSSPAEASSNGWTDEPTKAQNSGWGLPVTKPDHSVETSKTNTSNGWASTSESSFPEASCSDWIDDSTKEQHNGWGLPEKKLGKNKIQANFIPAPSQSSGWLDEPCKEDESNTQVTYIPQSHTIPSAPPIPIEGLDEGPIHYPSVDFSPVNCPVPCFENGKVGTSSSEMKDEDGSSSCVICWEAPVEGACVPCGHMAGCMACLNEVKTKKGDCPVCRTKITQVIKIYAV